MRTCILCTLDNPALEIGMLIVEMHRGPHPVAGLEIGRLGICLGQQNFKGRQVLKNLS